jgi:hypothetical protein
MLASLVMGKPDLTDTTLRPMSTGQVLDRTFQIYRSNFAVLAGVGVLLPTLLLLLRLAFVPLGFPMPRGTVVFNPVLFWTKTLEYFGSWMLVYMIGHALASAATVYAVSKLHLGEAVTIRECYRKTLPRFFTVLRIAWNIYLRFAGATILSYIVCVLVVFGWTELSGLAMSGAAKGLLVTIAVILGLATGMAGLFWILYLYAKYCLAVPACLVENLPGRPALRRSRFLAKGSIRRIILIYVLMILLGFALSVVFWLPGEFYVSWFRGRSFITAVLLRSLGSFLAGALAGPIATIAVALVYYDQRIRKEAFDLEWMMGAMAQPVPPLTPEAPVSIPQP